MTGYPDRWRLGEATHHWRRVLACTEGREEEQAAALAAEASTALLGIGFRVGLPHDELRALLTRCRAACEWLDDPARLGHALYLYAISCNFRGRLDESLASLDEALAIGRRLGNTHIEAGVLCTLQDRAWVLGDLEVVHELCDRVIELVAEDPHHIYTAGFSSFLESLAKRGAIRSELGRQAEGAADAERALQLAEDGAIPRDTLIFCLMMDGFRSPLFGAAREAAARARRLVGLAEASAGPFFVEISNSSAGMMNATLGRWPEAIGQLERSLQLARERGLKVWNEPAVLAELANAYRAVGRVADARAEAEAGVASGRRDGVRLGECRAQIALARVLIAEGATDSDTIDTALLRAEALVEETRGRGYLPFIAEARAELARVRGDAAGAARALAEAQRLFSEMGAVGHADRLGRAGSAS